MTQVARCCTEIRSLLPEDVASADFRRLAPLQAEQGTENMTDDLEPFFRAVRRGVPPGYMFDTPSRTIYQKDNPPAPICGPIRVASTPRRVDGSGWSIEVEYLDDNDRLKRATIPRVELYAGGGSAFTQLMDTGLAFYAGRSRVASILKFWRSTEHSWRVDAAGWFRDPDGWFSFVQADGRVHQPLVADIDGVVHATPNRQGVPAAGSLSGWQDEVAGQAIGNPALIFAVSAALAGPLLKWAGIETAGFNFYGPSASGKSLMLRLALSCSGPPHRLMPWFAAQTGLHHLSASCQDGLLVLDAFPRDAEAKHLKALLAIGDDAAAGRILSDRDPDGGRRWRRILLSGSELPLPTSLARKKRDIPAALSARIIDIPADHAANGVIAELHGAEDGLAFARRLEEAMQRHHGHALAAFLQRLVDDLPRIRMEIRDSVPAASRELQYNCDASAPHSPAASPAIAERFALIAIAGELAIGFGLLPWPAGIARQAASDLAALAHQRPDPIVGRIEHALGLVRDYVGRHAARIIDLDPETPIDLPPDAIGWQDDRHVYLRKQPAEEELDDADDLWSSLVEGDILEPGGEQRSHQYKMPARRVQGRPRCYRLNRDRLEEG